MKKVFLSICTLLFFASTCISQQNIKDFGAKGDGVTDDTQAFIKAVQSTQKLIIPKGIYNIKGLMSFNNLQNHEIILQDAVIRNTDNTKGTISFTGCTNLAIHGGTWTYTNLPTGNGGDAVMRITHCHIVEITHTHVLGSSEVGISLVCVLGANISNNVIEQCYRDGIYSHYSSGLIYACNYIHDIKDDAMSIHDYGIAAQRCELNDSHISQSGNSIIFNNITKNTYEGLSSIGCTRLFIASNTIQNTVNGGIAIFNSENLFKGGTAYANHIVISNNKLSGCGGNTHIIDKEYPNYGQISTGRAAIFVGVLDGKNAIIDPKSRIQYITINNNTATNCFENGAYLAQIDHLNFFGNTFRNNNISGSKYDGSAVEIKNCNGVSADANSIADNRTSTADNDHTYSLDRVSGTMGKWSINSRGPNTATSNSSLHNATELSKNAQATIPGFSIKPGEFKFIRQKFNSGILADYINIIPPAVISRKITCSACIDTGDGSIIIILSNNSPNELKVADANWGIKEFYHN